MFLPSVVPTGRSVVPEAHQVALAAADAGKGGSPLQLGALYVRDVRSAEVADEPAPA